MVAYTAHLALAHPDVGVSLDLLDRDNLGLARRDLGQLSLEPVVRPRAAVLAAPVPVLDSTRHRHGVCDALSCYAAVFALLYHRLDLDATEVR